MDSTHFSCYKVDHSSHLSFSFCKRICFSNEAHRGQKEKEEKLNRLEQRRNRLAAILEGEKLQFQVNQQFFFTLILFDFLRVNYRQFVNQHVNPYLI